MDTWNRPIAFRGNRVRGENANSTRQWPNTGRNPYFSHQSYHKNNIEGNDIVQESAIYIFIHKYELETQFFLFTPSLISNFFMFAKKLCNNSTNKGI